MKNMHTSQEHKVDHKVNRILQSIAGLLIDLKSDKGLACYSWVARMIGGLGFSGEGISSLMVAGWTLLELRTEDSMI